MNYLFSASTIRSTHIQHGRNREACLGERRKHHTIEAAGASLIFHQETTTTTTDSSLSVPPVRPSNERQETGLLDNIPITPASELPPTRAQRNVHFEEEEEEEEEAPPPRPARPTSPNTQNLATLIEAFPDIDTKIVKAVLTASGGQVEPAFNALLGELDWQVLETRLH